MISVLFAATALVLLQNPASRPELITACNAPIDERPLLSDIIVNDEPPEANDLPSLRVTHTASGGWLKVFYEPVTERAARARAACLGAQIALLEVELADQRRDAQWDSVVFTANPDYVSPRADAGQGRWIVSTRADGTLTEDGEGMIVSTMPHEQAHDYQNRATTRRSRWFQEGHATWVGLKVSALISPDHTATEIAGHEAALSDGAALRLAEWGGMQVRPEAILRQLSPEDRARKLADPSFNPPGPYRFGPDDVISDENNTSARYAAAWKVFVGLEARHGVDAVRAWVADLTSRSDTVTDAMAIASAKERFGEDITPLLQ
ncbi:hypothetical protein ACIQC9_14120 [Brevundimonas sp. NPDC092305]|uniref:hypothetical protein n=1 Tax=Brevundimonas sp. NPDC092305 TaxID=3363957 RepID=UPI00382ECFD7